MESSRAAICRRLRELRKQHFGPRGKSRFARALGIGPSTYAHYEEDRLPPADLLARAAEVTNTSLEWLLRGEGPREAAGPASGSSDDADRLSEELRRLLARRPDLAGHARQQIGLLHELIEQPDAGDSADVDVHATELIPVVGSTAAGLSTFWRDVDHLGIGPEAEHRLDDIVATHSSPSGVQRGVVHRGRAEQSDAVSLVQLSQPDEAGFLEFVNAPQIREQYPDALAWRIDGESMTPRYRDGDLVVTSGSEPAVDGAPCVARQTGQIGVTCKLYRREGDEVILIPINESYPTQRLPADQLMWAWRVLCAVRFG